LPPPELEASPDPLAQYLQDDVVHFGGNLLYWPGDIDHLPAAQLAEEGPVSVPLPSRDLERYFLLPRLAAPSPGRRGG